MLGGRILPPSCAVVTEQKEMDLFCLISKPVLFFSVENFRKPIRNHFLYLEAVAVADNYTVLMTMTITREKLSGEDSSFISFLVSVFPDI